MLIALTKKPAFKDQKCTSVVVHEDQLVGDVIEKACAATHVWDLSLIFVQVNSCIQAWGEMNQVKTGKRVVIGLLCLCMLSSPILPAFNTMLDKTIRSLDHSHTIKAIRKKNPDNATCYMLICDTVRALKSDRTTSRLPRLLSSTRSRPRTAGPTTCL